MSVPVRVWLDDERLPPIGWTWAKNYAECVMALESGNVVELSLDHDLGIEHYLNEPTKERTGYDVCLWLAERGGWPPVVRIHSANPAGRERMASVVQRYAPSSTRLVMMPPGGSGRPQNAKDRQPVGRRRYWWGE